MIFAIRYCLFSVVLSFLQHNSRGVRLCKGTGQNYLDNGELTAEICAVRALVNGFIGCLFW